MNDDKANRNNQQLHLLKVIVDKVRDDAMGHKGVCHVSFDPSNYRHGVVQTIHLTEQLNQYNLLEVSSHSWIEQAEQLEFF